MKKFIFICLFIFILFGCQTTKIEPDSTTTDFSKSVGKLELLVSNMENNVNQNKVIIENAISTAESFESELDKLEILFNTYESLVASMMEQKNRELSLLKSSLEELKNEK